VYRIAVKTDTALGFSNRAIVSASRVAGVVRYPQWGGVAEARGAGVSVARLGARPIS